MVHRYRVKGEAGFWRGTGNNHYRNSFKIKCVDAVLRGDCSVDDIVAKNNSSSYTLRSWIKCIISIWNSGITNRKERSIWQTHAENQPTVNPRYRYTVFDCCNHTAVCTGFYALAGLSKFDGFVFGISRLEVK